jgi:OPA family glycerol-3-phosphate transporter-like MFS transporter/OPA family sugar phosphate sensor protein UhpC-like MFS transporter
MTPEQTKKFHYWQWRTIIGTMIGYAIFYFVRKNFSYAIPGLTAEYGISNTTFGIIMTLVGLIYGISKFVNGVLADRTNGRWHMVTGLSVCTLTSLIFGCGTLLAEWITGQSYGSTFINTLVVIFAVLLVVNNLFQGCGFPPCNRLITHWVPPTELSTKMSIWNTSHSIGAGILAVICGLIMGHMGSDMSGDAEMRARVVENTANITKSMTPDAADAYVTHALEHVGAWQWAFWIPAFIAIGGIIFIIVTLRDTPKSVGLPELKGSVVEASDAKKDSKESSAEFKEFLRRKVFFNPVIWALALADFFVYIIRFAVLDWGPTFLRASRGLSADMAGWTVAIFELFGCAGMLLAGWFTDRYMGGRAQRTCVLCMIGAILFITAFCTLPATTSPIVLLLILACAGFFIYGPQALIGVVASNHATRRAASTANGVIGMVSYVSVAVSGVGFGYLSDHAGWQWVFVVMVAMAIVGLMTLLPMWNMKRDAYDEETQA